MPGDSVVKNLLAMKEMWVPPLGQEVPLEKKMPTHSSLLAWKIPRQRSLAGCSPWGPKRVGHGLAIKQRQRIIKVIETERRMVVSRAWVYDNLVFNGDRGSVGKDRKVLEVTVVDCCTSV